MIGRRTGQTVGGRQGECRLTHGGEAAIISVEVNNVATMSVEEIYERHIKPLSPVERLRLVAMTAQDLAQQPSVNQIERRHR